MPGASTGRARSWTASRVSRSRRWNEPLARGPAAELARLRRETAVPLMADEWLVTLADADDLIAAEAVDFFNVRVSPSAGVVR